MLAVLVHELSKYLYIPNLKLCLNYRRITFFTRNHKEDYCGKRRT
jgi:hypothetical protein